MKTVLRLALLAVAALLSGCMTLYGGFEACASTARGCDATGRPVRAAPAQSGPVRPSWGGSYGGGMVGPGPQGTGPMTPAGPQGSGPMAGPVSNVPRGGELLGVTQGQRPPGWDVDPATGKFLPPLSVCKPGQTGYRWCEGATCTVRCYDSVGTPPPGVSQ